MAATGVLVGVRRRAEEFFATHLLVAAAGSFLFYALDGLAWILIFQAWFPALKGDVGFASGLADLSLIIGFVYSGFVRQQTSGYTDQAQLYMRFLVDIRDSAQRLAGLYEAEPNEQRAKIRVHVRNIVSAYQMLAVATFRIFAPWNRDRVGSEDRETRPSAIKALRVGASEMLKRVVRTLGIGHFTAELRDIQDEKFGDPIALSRRIQRFVERERAHLHQRGLNDVALQRAAAPEAEVWTRLNDIEISASISEPKIFTSHWGAILFLFFLVWIPITLWVRFRPEVAAVLYPCLAYLFLEPGVYRFWLKDPFDPGRPSSVWSPIRARDRIGVRDLEALLPAASSLRRADV